VKSTAARKPSAGAGARRKGLARSHRRFVGLFFIVTDRRTIANTQRSKRTRLTSNGRNLFFAVVCSSGPEPDRAVAGPGRQHLPIAAEGERAYLGGVSAEGEDLLKRFHIPQLDRAILAAGRQAPAVRGEGNPDDVACVAFECSQLDPRAQFPQPHRFPPVRS